MNELGLLLAQPANQYYLGIFIIAAIILIGQWAYGDFDN